MTLEARRAAETRFGRTGAIIVGAVVAVLAVTGGAFVIAGANPARGLLRLLRRAADPRVHALGGPQRLDAAALRGRGRGHRLPRRLLEHRRRRAAAHGRRGRGRHRPGRARLAVHRGAAAHGRGRRAGRRGLGARAGAAARAPRHRRGRHHAAAQPGGAAGRGGPAPRAMDGPGDRLPGVAAHRRSRGVPQAGGLPALPGQVAAAPRLHPRHRHHHRGLVGAEPHLDRPARAGRGPLAARGTLRRHQGRADAPAGGARQRRRRRHRRRQRGGRHPVPAHGGHLARASATRASWWPCWAA